MVNVVEKIKNVAFGTLAPIIYDTSTCLRFFHDSKVINLIKLLPIINVAGAVTGSLISAKKLFDLSAEYFNGKGKHHMLRLIQNTSALALAVFIVMPVCSPINYSILTVNVATNCLSLIV